MLALHSRTEISLILQEFTEKLANFLSGGCQHLAPLKAWRDTYGASSFPNVHLLIASILSVQVHAATDRESRD